MEKDGSGGGGRNSQVEETTGAKVQQHPTAKYTWEVVNVLACNQKGRHKHRAARMRSVHGNMHFCLNNHSDFGAP